MHCASLSKPRSSTTASTARTSPHGSYQIQSATQGYGTSTSPATQDAPETSTTTAMPSVETSRTYNQNTAAPTDPETRSAQSSGSQDGPSTTSNNVNLKQLDPLQLLQQLSSRCAPAKALETIAAELITGRMWINLLAGPTATDELSKFFGVTSRIQQTRLVSEAQESIETDASKTQRMSDSACGFEPQKSTHDVRT